MRQRDDLLVARTRTSNSDLLLVQLELLAEEEPWQPLVCAETETAQLAVVGFDISQARETQREVERGRERQYSPDGD